MTDHSRKLRNQNAVSVKGLAADLYDLWQQLGELDTAELDCYTEAQVRTLRELQQTVVASYTLNNWEPREGL